ncbi:hypothetical protein RND81_12G194000 [Saponaria officinalis]|uniref:SWIM-type domain-containing protein n=1 Tax=Saponaria officinalis TaxID=3572 RepID=A0AAW1HCP6_SAPOF
MSKPKSSNTKKMSITRCKCMACIRTQINENGLWEVNLSVTQRDHINFVNRLKMHAIEGGDASTLVNLLNKRQTEDPGFFLSGYLLYHDVVIFDTTYRTNRYNLICGALVDVIPTSIFTDQDLAMTNAIEKVYPSSKHRLCQWHIHQNAISHFGSLKHDRTFQQTFNKCLNGCYSEAEFEDTWGTMVEEYGLHNNMWFQRLYVLKEKWCTALNRNFFSAGILSSQRSESTNHALGFQASKTTSLTEFYHIFEEMVKRWRPEEDPPRSIQWVFENEFATAMGTRAVECGTYGSTLSYIVHSSACSEIPHHVSFDCDNLLIECTCRKFQEMRMLCYHLIRILHIHSISEIPDHYILKRWTKFAKKNVWDRLLPNDRRKASINDAINWRRETLTNFNNLITKCLNVPEARVILDKAYATAHEAVHALSTSTNVECPTTSSTQTTNQILDPKRSITKGRSRRKKSGITKRNTKGAKQTQSEAPTYTPIPRLF